MEEYFEEKEKKIKEDYFEFFTKYFDFKGRTTRKIYWLTWVALLIVGIIINHIDNNAISIIWSLGIFIPNLAIIVRRLHDSNKSGLWLLLIYIPAIIGLIVLGLAALTLISAGVMTLDWQLVDTVNLTESFSTSLWVQLMISLFFLVVAIAGEITIFIFTLLPSKNENNKYGELPVEK